MPGPPRTVPGRGPGCGRDGCDRAGRGLGSAPRGWRPRRSRREWPGAWRCPSPASPWPSQRRAPGIAGSTSSRFPRRAGVRRRRGGVRRRASGWPRPRRGPATGASPPARMAAVWRQRWRGVEELGSHCRAFLGPTGQREGRDEEFQDRPSQWPVGCQVTCSEQGVHRGRQGSRAQRVPTRLQEQLDGQAQVPGLLRELCGHAAPRPGQAGVRGPDRRSACPARAARTCGSRRSSTASRGQGMPEPVGIPSWLSRRVRPPAAGPSRRCRGPPGRRRAEAATGTADPGARRPPRRAAGRGEGREAGGDGGRERRRNPRGREQLLDQERHPIGDTDNALDVLGGRLGPTCPDHGGRFGARQWVQRRTPGCSCGR